VVWIRKAHAGSDSFGNTWPTDGAVIDVPENEALALLAIPDAECSRATQPEREPASAGEDAAPADAPPVRRGRPPKPKATA
jgi:hypothetical protein